MAKQNRSQQKPFLRYILSKKKGGGRRTAAEYFREKRLRRIVRGEKLFSYEKAAGMVFGKSAVGKALSGIIGELFDKDIPKEEKQAAKEQLRQEFGIKFSSDKAKRQTQLQEETLKRVDNINDGITAMKQMIDLARNETSSRFDSVMQSLKLLTEPPPEVTPTVTKEDIEAISRKLFEVDAGQRRIETLLIKGSGSGKKVAKAVRKAVRESRPEPIENITRTFVEQVPERQDELTDVLNAIARQQKINQIEPDEMEEILKKALVKALEQMGYNPFGSGGGGMGLNIPIPIPGGGGNKPTPPRPTPGPTSPIPPVPTPEPKEDGKLGKILKIGGKWLGPAAVIGTAAYSIKEGNAQIDKALSEGLMTKEQADQAKKELLYRTAGQTIGAAVGGVAGAIIPVPGAAIGGTLAGGAIGGKIAEALIGGDSKPNVVPAPAPMINPTTGELVDKSRENAASTTPIAAPSAVPPLTQNFFNTTSATTQIPEKRKIQPNNTDNTFARLVAQDIEHPATYSNFNMG